MRLLDAGAAPHRTLRVVPPSERTQHVRLRLDCTGTNEDPQERVNRACFQAELRLYRSTARHGEGEFLVEVLRLDIEEAGEEVEGARELVDLVPKMCGRGIVGVLGEVLEFHIGIGDSADPEVISEFLKQALTRLGPMLPKDPVGVGATWEREFDIDSYGKRVACATQFKLLDVEPERVRLGVEVALSTPAQVVIRRVGDEELRGDVAATSGSLVGTLIVSLNGFLPTGALHVHLEEKETVLFRGHQHAHDSVMEIKVELEEL